MNEEKLKVEETLTAPYEGYMVIKPSLYEKMQKEHKALEIIKKHPMFYLHDDLPKGTYRMYDCELYSHYDLTQEEFETLKEVGL